MRAHSYLSVDNEVRAADASEGGCSTGLSSLGALTGSDSQAAASSADGGGTGASTGAAAGTGTVTGAGAAVVELMAVVALDC